MARLTENTHVRHPETGELAFLVAGGDVPDWASSLVGEHLVEGAPGRGRKSSTPKVPTEDPAAELARLEARIAELKASPPASAPANTDGASQDGPPPKGGAGSGAPAWREYAAKNDVEVPADASREDVVAALDAAGVRTE